MLQRVNTLVTDLDGHRGDITDALDGVNRLSATLATRKQQVGTVLTGLSPGLKVLEDQRGSLFTMLKSLDTLSTVAVATVNKSKDDMVADLKAIAPTLKSLADSGKDLPDSLQVLLTYPFTDEVLRGRQGRLPQRLPRCDGRARHADHSAAHDGARSDGVTDVTGVDCAESGGQVAGHAERSRWSGRSGRSGRWGRPKQPKWAERPGRSR